MDRIHDPRRERRTGVRNVRWAAMLLVMVLMTVGIAATARADDTADFYAANDKAIAASAKPDYPEAARQYEKALSLATKVFGENHENTASIVNNLANVYSDLGQYAKSEPLFQRSLKIQEAKLGPDHPYVAVSLNNLANLYLVMGQYAKAEPLYERSLKIREAKFGPDHPDVAMSVQCLAILYENMGHYAQAEPLYRRSLKINEAKLGPDHSDVAANLNSLAHLYMAMGQYSKAEPLFQRSLKIQEAKLGPEHPAVARTLNNLALLNQKMGQYSRSESLFQRGLKILETTLGPVHPDVANCVAALASLYEDMEQYSKAELLYQRCLKIREGKVGPDHPDVANSLNDMAVMYTKTGQYAKAEPLYERSLKIYEAKLGTDHANVGTTLNNLAFLHGKLGQYAKAEPMFQRSLRIREAKLGPDHPEVAASLRNLAVLHAALDVPKRAADEFDRARRIVRKHVTEVLPMLSEQEQLSFLDRKDRKDFHAALTLGWTKTGDAANATRSATWLANGKAVAQETLVQRAVLAGQTSDDRLKAFVEKLTATRTRLAKLTNIAPPTGQEAAYKAERLQLAEQEQDQAKQLNRAGGVSAIAPWVELADIRRNLPKDALLVDIVRFEPAIFGATGEEKGIGQARYAAWLTPPAGLGDVKVIDLGEAHLIDAAVGTYQTAFKPCQSPDKTENPLLSLGEPEAEKQLQAALDNVAKLVLQPLLPDIADKQELILSPDAALWLVPWVALSIGDGQYAIEKWNIHYVISARDLAGEHRKLSMNPPRIFANPNYNLSLAESRQALAGVFGGAAAPASPAATAAGLLAMNDLRSRSANTFGPVPLLPGTAQEAAAITPSLKTFAQGEPKLYADKQALEGVFKRLAAPRVLVLSTHGFFLPDQEIKTDDKQAGLAGEADKKTALVDKEGRAVENPMLRCGLLFAGCNNRDQIPANSDLDDGVLTGMEIVGTNLRGTELVVLSACETGLGQVNNGEGVAGLRQAFQLAGVQSAVATLWQIPDVQSALLMNDFFANLATGQAKADALRNAQLARIKARREKYGAAHPLYWAAFALTGQ